MRHMSQTVQAAHQPQDTHDSDTQLRCVDITQLYSYGSSPDELARRRWRLRLSSDRVEYYTHNFIIYILYTK